MNYELKDNEDYRMFKDRVEREFHDYLPDGCVVDFRTVQKVNVEKTAVIVSEPGKSCTVMPQVYVEDMYHHYGSVGNFGKTMDFFASKVVHGRMPESILAGLQDIDPASVTFQVINRERNGDYLSGLPHRDFCDLAIVYRIILSVEERHVASAVVTDALAKKMGLDEESLYRLAYKNTRRIMEPAVLSVAELVGAPDMMPLYAITNKSMVNGAASILYGDVLDDAAERMGSEKMYLLPSSIHEFLAVPYVDGDLKGLAGIVGMVNSTEVSDDDYLSGSVYMYSRADGMVRLADSPDSGFPLS